MHRTAAVLITALALAAATLAARPVAAAPAPDLATTRGWIETLSAWGEHTSLVIDDGRGRRVEHRADADQPLASAYKVVPLLAYARAVADGTLDPNEQVPLAQWERWYLPGTDGGAHPAALTRLGLDASDPSATVKLDDMVSAMIQESDNAVPDYLRARLGDRAEIDAAAAGGWPGYQPSSVVGTILALAVPGESNSEPWELARRYADDAAFRTRALETGALPSVEDQIGWFTRNGPRGSASNLAAIYSTIVSGGYGTAGDIARRQLQWQSPSPGFTAVGFKGGLLPGVLTQAFEVTRPDGTRGVAVWLIDGIDAATFARIPTTFVVQQQLILEALDDPATLDAVACAAR